MPRLTVSREFATVGILCVAFGVVNFEMVGINCLLPFIEPSLRLNDTQVGLVLSGFWVTFATSSYLVGAGASRFGGMKRLFVLTLVVFSVSSIISGLVASFVALLAARLLMGLLEGPALPLAQSMVSLESAPERRGRNTGIVQNLGSGIMGSLVAPLLLVYLATSYSWRAGFFVVVLPGLICAAIAARYLQEPRVDGSMGRPIAQSAKGGENGKGARALREALTSRNVLLCAATASVGLAHVTIGLGFLPLFFMQARHFSPKEMSLSMSVLGASATILGVGLPAISDRLGRKAVMIGAAVLGLLCPLAVIFYSGSPVLLDIAMFIGWAPAAANILCFSTIPSESVSARSVSTAIGLILAISTIVGGVVAPTAAGWMADRWGLEGALYLQLGCAGFAAVTATLLRETSKKRITRSGQEGSTDQKCGDLRHDSL